LGFIGQVYEIFSSDLPRHSSNYAAAVRLQRLREFRSLILFPWKKSHSHVSRFDPQPQPTQSRPGARPGRSFLPKRSATPTFSSQGLTIRSDYPTQWAKIADKAVCRSVFLTIRHCILKLTKAHSSFKLRIDSLVAWLIPTIGLQPYLLSIHRIGLVRANKVLSVKQRWNTSFIRINFGFKFSRGIFNKNTSSKLI